MAVEWSKNINFLGFFKKKVQPAKTGYPTKTYINLMIPDEREEAGKRGIVTAVLALVVLLLFAKFGVYDYFARVMAKNSELNERTAELSEYTILLANYDKVLATYNSYEAVRMTTNADDVALVDVFELVDKHISTIAKVSTFNLADNILTLHLYDIQLDSVSSLVGDLYQQPIVKTVEVQTAARQTNTYDTNESNSHSVTLTLELQSTAAEAVAEGAVSLDDTATSGS